MGQNREVKSLNRGTRKRVMTRNTTLRAVLPPGSVLGRGLQRVFAFWECFMFFIKIVSKSFCSSTSSLTLVLPIYANFHLLTSFMFENTSFFRCFLIYLRTLGVHQYSKISINIFFICAVVHVSFSS